MKIIFLFVLASLSAPAFGGGCAAGLFLKARQKMGLEGRGRQAADSAEDGRFMEPAPRFYRMDGARGPRGLAESRHQQLVIGEEGIYFILDGKIAKKSLSNDEWRFLGGLSGARAILPGEDSSLLALTESRRVYRLKEGADGSHEWILFNKGVIKMFYSKAGELVFLLGTDKETAISLAGH